MGFAVYYRTARPVTPDEADALRSAVDAASDGRTWLSCEPPYFFEDLEDGRLVGFSKPNFLPDPADAASAASEGLPDGTLADLVEVLCVLSRDHGVDWEFRHDEVPWSIGSIRDGVADPDLLDRMDALDDLGDVLREFEGLDDFDPA